MKPRPGPCSDCPFLKSSRRGNLTFDPAREGFYSSAEPMLNMVTKNEPQTCHTEIKQGKTPLSQCSGFTKFKEGTNPHFIKTPEEFRSHHVVYEGPLLPLIWETPIGN